MDSLGLKTHYMFILTTKIITVKGYEASAKGKKSMELSLGEPGHKIPKVFSQWRPQYILNPPEVSWDSTCEILSIREAHQRPSAQGFHWGPAI